MIQPGVYNISLQRRADYSVQFGFQGSDKQPLNLTGWTVAAQVWNQARTTKYGDFIVTYQNRAQGLVQLKLDHSTTADLPNESVYDVLLTNPSGEREYYVEGTIKASEGYTSP